MQDFFHEDVEPDKLITSFSCNFATSGYQKPPSVVSASPSLKMPEGLKLQVYFGDTLW
jgi:hypothetical protein